MFYGPKSPWPLQLINLGRHILGFSNLPLDYDIRYHEHKFWQKMCLLTSTSVTGITTAILPAVWHPAFPGVPGTITMVSNLALNVYATLFITTRLLAHRKMVITAMGNKILVARHLQIVTILLESAAVNLPITIATAVGLVTGKTFGGVIGPIAAPSQVRAHYSTEVYPTERMD